MNISLIKALFISLLLSVVASTMQAVEKETGWADTTLDFISSGFTSLESDAIGYLAKVKPYLDERAKNWSTKNPKTVARLNDNPKIVFGLVGAAIVIIGYTVRMAYTSTKTLFTYLFNRARGNNSK